MAHVVPEPHVEFAQLLKHKVLHLLISVSRVKTLVCNDLIDIQIREVWLVDPAADNSECIPDANPYCQLDVPAAVAF